MGTIANCFLLLLLNSVGIIGFMQWLKELVSSISSKDTSSTWKCLLTLLLSIVSGFVSWKVGFGSCEWWMSIPLALGTLAITQLGYECIIKNLCAAIETVMSDVANITINKKDAR